MESGGKKSFVLYNDYSEIFSKLSDAEAGILIKHIFAFVNNPNENASAPDRLTDLIFHPIKNQLHRDFGKWEEVARKRAEAGAKGGIRSGQSRSKNKNEANEANASFGSKKEANEAVTVTGTVTVNDNVKSLNKDSENNEHQIFTPRPSKAEQFFQEFYNSPDLDLVCMQGNIDKSEALRRLSEFKPLMNLTYKNSIDFATHFKNWMLKKGYTKTAIKQNTENVGTFGRKHFRSEAEKAEYFKKNPKSQPNNPGLSQQPYHDLNTDGI